jgi:ubiquinone/menaquinone biosynthesis C-methylase UbiE
MNAHNEQFDRIAEQYDATLPAHVMAHYLQKRAAFIAAQGGRCGLALDVGCGTGVLADALASVGWTVVGVDVSLGMLRVMQKRGGWPVQASACDLPVPADTFDLVYSVAAMHHIAEPGAVRRTLRGMYRVCRPGGVIIIWDHNARNPYWPIIMARVPQDTGEERIIPVEEINAAFAHQSEVAAHDIYYMGFVPDFAPRVLLPAFQRLERLVEAWPRLSRYLCAHNVVVVRKRGLVSEDL